MAWDWVAPLAGGVVGVVGVAGTAVVAITSQRHNERLAAQRNSHERQLAEDARRQQRLADAYVELLEFVHASGAWCEKVMPFYKRGGERQALSLPEFPQQVKVLALADAFATPEARDLTTGWWGAVNDIIAIVEDLAWAEEHGDTDEFSSPNARRELDQTLRPAERKAREELAAQIAADLGHRARMD